MLEKLFEKPAGDATETRRREELLTYVVGFHSNQMLNVSCSKLKTVEETLRSLHQKSVLLRFTDHVQDNEDVSGLLEDLQEAISDYQVR